MIFKSYFNCIRNKIILFYFILYLCNEEYFKKFEKLFLNDGHFYKIKFKKY